MRIVRAASSYRGGRVRPYLATVARSAAIDHMRRARITVSLDDEDGEGAAAAASVVDEGPHPDEAFESRATSEDVRRAVRALFLAGFLVSLLESVCTGQVYIPTINLIIKNNPAQVTAWLWLVFYNSLFALPLVVLTFLAAFGLRSQFMLKVQRKGAFPIRIGMALLFLFMAALLIAQLR